jgi:ABC-2 type transport system permease protein
MRNFFNVLIFEFFAIVKAKAFVVSTCIVAIILVLLGFYPVYAGLFKTANQPKELKKAVAFTGFPEKDILEAFPEYEWIFAASETELTDALNSEKTADSPGYAIGLFLSSASSETGEPGEYKIYYADRNLFESLSENALVNMLRRDYQREFLRGAGVFETADAERTFFEPEIKGETVNFGKDITESYWSGYFLLMFLYMLLMIYNQQIMASVAREKSTKTMEILISSVDIRSLVFGKVVGSVFAALFQAAIMMGVAFISITLTRPAWAAVAPSVLAIVDMSLNLKMILFSLAFLALGFFAYSFLFAGFASTISRIEDLQQVAMVPTLTVVAAFLIAMAGTMTPTAGFVKVCSWIPFLSPFVMYVRICVSTVPPLSVAVAVLINLISILLSGFIGARIYRAGVLMYGKSATFKEILGAVFGSA